MKVKLLYINQYFNTRAGLGSTRSYEFARYLVSRGHQVTIVTGKTDKNRDCFQSLDQNGLIQTSKIDGIRVVAINVQYLNRMKYLRRLWSFICFGILSSIVVLSERHADLVFVTSTPPTVGIPGIIGTKLKRVPFIFEVRDLWPDVPIEMGIIKNGFLITAAKFLEMVIYKNALKIIALSPGVVERIAEKKISPAKIHLIPNCADLELFTPNISDGILRTTYGLQGKYICIHTGAMGKVNGLDIVIRTAEVLGKKDRNVVFVMIGEGKEKKNLIRRKNELNLRNVLILDPVPHYKMPKYIADSNLCLMLVANIKILENNSANKFFEYLSSGKPVLLNYGGWMKEELEAHNSGVAVEPDSPKVMADMILMLKNNPKLCAEMGKNARKLAEEKFDREKLAKKLENVFIGVVQDARTNKTSN